MGTSKFVEPNEMDDAFETGFEDSSFANEESELKNNASGGARKAIERLLEEKRLREMLDDDFDDTFEA